MLHVFKLPSINPRVVLLVSLLVVVSFQFASAQGNRWRIQGNTGTNPADNFLGTVDEQDLVLRTQDTERVRVTSRGNVGINETSPGSRLVVRNDSVGQRPLMSVFAGQRRTFHLSSTGSVDVDPTGAGVALRVRAAGDRIGRATPVPFYVTGANDANAIYVSRSANIGLGTAGEGIGDRLWVRGNDNNGTRATVRIISGQSQQTMLLDGNEIDAISNGLFLNHNTDNNVMLATGGGNVGVGTTTPNVALDIQGEDDGTDLRITDNRFSRIRMVATDSAENVVVSMQARATPNTQRAELGTVSNSPLVLFTNGQTRLSLGADGSVCLGSC